MKTRRWLVVLVTAIALAVLGTGAVLAAPWAQEAPPPEGTAPEAAPARGFVGAAVRNLNEKLLERLGLPEGTTGVVVTHVLPHGPAREAGLQSRDVITAVDGEPIAGVAALRQTLAGKAQGDSVTLTVLRDGEEQTISLTLGETPVRPHEGKSAPKIVDGEFRVLKDDALVTIRVAAGTVVAVEGDTLTIEKETPDQEQVSFTIAGDTKVFDKGKAVELSALVGKQVVVYGRGWCGQAGAGGAVPSASEAASPLWPAWGGGAAWHSGWPAGKPTSATGI